MTGPGDEVAADTGGGGHLRASHADREQAVGVLKAAFVQGRLAKDEFDLRMAQALASRTYAELAALSADLPAGLTAARPEPARGSAGDTVRAWARAAVVFTGISSGIAVATGDDTGERLIGAVLFVVFTAMLMAVLVSFHSWLERRVVRQSPPGDDGAGSSLPRVA